MSLFRKLLMLFHLRTPFVIGLTIGISLSLIIMPFVEDCASDEDPKRSASLKTPHDDYEPVINLNTKPKISRKPRVVLRPRYYSTELGIKEKLFIGVFSSANTISSLATAVNRTLSKYSNRLFYFLADEPSAKTDVALNNFVKFTDIYQSLLSLYAIEYISEKFPREFDFYFFIRDTTFVMGEQLLHLVENISVSQSVHMGTKKTVDSVECNIDAGVLLSGDVFLKASRNIRWCMEHALTEDADYSFGHCVLKGSSLPCAESSQGKHFKSFQLKNTSFPEADSLQDILTIYPVENAQQHFFLHGRFCEKDLQRTYRMIVETEKKIMQISKYDMRSEVFEKSWPVGLEPQTKPKNRYDVIDWSYFNTTHIFFNGDFDVVQELKGVQTMDIEHVLESAQKWLTEQYPNSEIIRLLNGYQRFNPVRGMEYFIDILLVDKTTGRDTAKRLELIRPLNKAEIISVPYVTEHTRIVLVLPIRSFEAEESAVFLEEYAQTCLEKQDNTVLIFILLYGPNDPGKGSENDVFGEVKSLITDYTNKYRTIGAKIAWISLKILKTPLAEIAIMDLVVRKLMPDSLVLVCKVGTELHTDYLNRVRMNTIYQFQVFSPIPYIQFHPGIAYKNNAPLAYIEVKKDHGHFDILNFDHVSFYVFDYLAARKSIEKEVPIAKTEKDIRNELYYSVVYTVFDMFVTSKNIHVMHAVEPELRIRFFLRPCDHEPNSKAYSNCIKSQHRSLGSKSDLTRLILTRENVPNKGQLKEN